jgi:hypothetical protein
MTPETLAGALEDLLVRAEASHLAYQIEHGVTDWPPYYAAQLHSALSGEYSLEQITTALRDAAAAHGEYEQENGGRHDAQWPRWYAEHMAGALSRKWYSFLAQLEAWDY